MFNRCFGTHAAVAFLMTLPVITAASNDPAAAQEGRAVIIVEVSTRNLPDVFDTEGRDVPGILKAEMEKMAAKLLEDKFPLFAWVTDTHRAVNVHEAARLFIDMKVETGLVSTISLPCAYSIGGSNAAPKPLGFAPSNLYNSEPLPGLDEIESDPLSRADERLTRFITSGENDSRWQDNFISAVPLAMDIEATDTQCLVILARESDLMADYDSVLKATLKTDLPHRGQRTGRFELTPDGAVSQGLLAGMQICFVRHFDFEGQSHSGWHPDIPDVIKYRIKPTIRVHVTKYVRNSSMISSNPN